MNEQKDRNKERNNPYFFHAGWKAINVPLLKSYFLKSSNRGNVMKMTVQRELF